MTTKCDCFFCNELGIEGIDVTVSTYVEHIADTVHTVDQLYEACQALFNKAYMLGFQSAVIERLEQDVETLKYIKNIKE